jgi:3-isopropylmalate/(R)-2-methylmalate dehydratase small subunit
LGKAWKYGDNIDTDVIIPARYLTTSDPAVLASHALEDLDKSFASEVQPGDVVVAGENFGCGSSREHAATCLKAAGVSAVVASSFARIFFRNAINTGLPIAVSPEAVAAATHGDELEVDLEAARVRNVTNGEEYPVEPLPDFVMDIVRAGGLVGWVRGRMQTSSV